MKPTVICLISSSIDGGLHASRWTASPDGEVADWTRAYETLHDDLAADAWMVGRVTMAEMSKATAHPPTDADAVERPVHVAAKADRYAVAIDAGGKLHFDGPTVGGDQAVVLLSAGVSDAHLAELAADGVSYVISDGDTIDMPAALEVLNDRFGIERLLLEGGAGANGSLLAQGLVDELHVLVAPALDGATDMQGIVAHDGGLKGRLQLAFREARVLDHGVVDLTYDVRPA